MITITSYVHRDVLKDLIHRWIHNEPRASDGEELTRLVHFNNAYVSRYLSDFAETLFTELYPFPLQSRRAWCKGDLKDVIVQNVPNRTPRVEEMLADYHNRPEIFYGETPFHGTLYLGCLRDQVFYIGSHRIKRAKRLAEKSARRIIDWMFATIKRHADALAEKRARNLGIRREQLISHPKDMIAEFLRAESRLLEDLKQHRQIQGTDDLVIQDVAGIKVIVDDAGPEPFMERIGNMSGCEIIEVEHHSGRYNATNLIVRLRPDREKITGRPLGERLLRIMQTRGIDPETANRQFQEFVRSGEERVHLEIIASTYQEMLESEIGSCMHEDRIIRQRLEQPYNAQLAHNIEYLMEYLFAFPASSQLTLGELPIKLWHRYLPDYFDDVLKKLFDIQPAEVLD